MVDIAYLNTLRRTEMEQLLPLLPSHSRILDFGAGTGEQARFLADRGFDVVAIDLATSNYAGERSFPIQEYDGKHIPVANQSIDVIFSSNVLEHVEDLSAILAEFRRIQAPGGFGLHVMPTPAWRSWTFVTAMAASVTAALALPFRLVGRPDSLSRKQILGRDLRRVISGFIPRGHGTSVEGLSELWTFSRSNWRRRFRSHGFEILEEKPMGLFYTGTLLLGCDISLSARRRLSRMLGSATCLYRVRAKPPRD